MACIAFVLLVMIVSRVKIAKKFKDNEKDYALYKKASNRDIAIYAALLAVMILDSIFDLKALLF